MALSHDQISFFQKRGYLLIRNVLSAAEVSDLRIACQQTNETQSVLGVPTFTKLLLDARIIDPLKQLLGPDIIHFGEASCRYDDRVTHSVTRSRSRHFHNDSRDDDFDFTKPYPAIRVGLYLQDHSKSSGGLKLRPGSCTKLCMDRLGVRGAIRYIRTRKTLPHLWMGRSMNVPSHAGDLVLWNLRTHHSGYAVRLKGFRFVSLHPAVENLLPEWCVAPEETERSVIFSTYGAPSDYFEKFIHNRTTRDAEFWNDCGMDRTAVLALAKKVGVTIR